MTDTPQGEAPMTEPQVDEREAPEVRLRRWVNAAPKNTAQVMQPEGQADLRQVLDEHQEIRKARAEVLACQGDLSSMKRRIDIYVAALRDIRDRATYERNPDGEDQAAATMQLLAREALTAARPGTQDDPDPAESRLQEMEEALRKTTRVLEPFALEYARVRPSMTEEIDVRAAGFDPDDGEPTDLEITLGELKAARAALVALPSEFKPEPYKEPSSIREARSHTEGEG